MEENQFQELSQTFTAAPPIKPRKRLPKRTLILIVIVILFVLAVLYIKATGKSKNQQTTTASMAPSATESPASSPLSSETPSFSPTPTSTPRPSVNPVDKQTGLDRSQLNVVIQNGSGEAGVAVKASDYLKGLGYNVSSTGNAETYDFINVFIQVKADKSDYLSLLKKDLGFNYTIGTTSADLSSGAGEDALVIIGK